MKRKLLSIALLITVVTGLSSCYVQGGNGYHHRHHYDRHYGDHYDNRYDNRGRY